MKEVIELFSWSKKEEAQLNKLSLKKTSILNGTLDEKEYKHLTYLFEAVYAVAIEPRNNISQNPTGKWELKYLGK